MKVLMDVLVLAITSFALAFALTFVLAFRAGSL
jgi:hypothetical protein